MDKVEARIVIASSDQRSSGIVTEREQTLNRTRQNINPTPGKAYVPTGLSTAEVRWPN
jgi:hypothetical protein